MALYTYSDFENEAKRLGHYDTLSKADINLAKSNPDVGMSLLKYVNDYFSETNTSKKRQLENSINNLRQNYGGYKITNGQLQLTTPTATNFNYISPYADRISALTDAIANRQPFSFDAEKDPSAMAARKSYMRDSKRATEDAIASAAAMTGGIPSSYAVMAGTQAGDYHASEFADKVQALEEAAYNRYLNEESLKKDELNSLLEREDNERNEAYTEHMNKVNTSGYGTSYSNYNTSYNYGGNSGTSGSGSSSIFDVLPKTAAVVTPDTSTNTETPGTSNTENMENSSQLPTSPSTPVTSPSDYNNTYYGGSSGTKNYGNSSLQNALPAPTVTETKPTETPSPETQTPSGNDVSSALPAPSDTPISSASGTTGGTIKTETTTPTTPNTSNDSDLVSQAGGFSKAYSELVKLGYSPISKATFDRMKQQGQVDGAISVAGVAKYKTYEDYLNYLLNYASR